MFAIQHIDTKEYFTGYFNHASANNATFGLIVDGYIACWLNKSDAEDYIRRLTAYRGQWTVVPKEKLMVVEV